VSVKDTFFKFFSSFPSAAGGGDWRSHSSPEGFDLPAVSSLPISQVPTALAPVFLVSIYRVVFNSMSMKGKGKVSRKNDPIVIGSFRQPEVAPVECGEKEENVGRKNPARTNRGAILAASGACSSREPYIHVQPARPSVKLANMLTDYANAVTAMSECETSVTTSVTSQASRSRSQKRNARHKAKRMRSASPGSSDTASQNDDEPALFDANLAQQEDPVLNDEPPGVGATSVQVPVAQSALQPAQQPVAQQTDQPAVAQDAHPAAKRTRIDKGTVAYVEQLRLLYGYTPGVVLRDGNCLYSAMSRLVYAEELPNQSQRMREDIVRYAQQRTDLHALIEAVDSVPFDEWIARTLTDGVWGSFMHVLLAEELFDMRILIFMVGKALTPLAWDETAYTAIKYRPVKALLFDEATRHYSPLGRPGEDVAVPLTGSQTLAMARSTFWQEQVEVIQETPEVVQLFDTHLQLDSMGPCRAPASAQPQSHGHTPGQPAVTGRQSFPPNGWRAGPSGREEDRGHMAARGQAPPSVAAKPTHPLRSGPPEPVGAGGSRQGYQVECAPWETVFNPQTSVRTTTALFQPATVTNQPVQPTAPALPGSLAPLTNLAWPHWLEDFMAFQSAPAVFPPPLGSRLRAVGRPLQQGDVVVLPSLADAPSPRAPQSWEALAACQLLLYAVRAFSESGVILQHKGLLWSPSAQATPSVWPLQTYLSAMSSWFVTYDESARETGPAVATLVPDIYGAAQPATFSRPPSLAYCELGPTVQDSTHLVQFADNLGVKHTMSKSAGPVKARRLEPLSVLAGLQRLQQLTGRAGMFVANYTASVLLSGAIECWSATQRGLYPVNAYPVVPFADLHWYAHSEEGELGFRVLCFDWVHMREHHTPSLRLGHFLPVAMANTLTLGTLTTREHWLKGLEGVGLSYGALYHEEFSTQFVALVSKLRSAQIGYFFMPAFVESLVLATLASFHHRAMTINDPFTLPGSTELIHPRVVTVEQWPRYMCAELWHVLLNANAMHDMQFGRMAAEGPAPAPPSGFKAPSGRLTSDRSTEPPRTQQAAASAAAGKGKGKDQGRGKDKDKDKPKSKAGGAQAPCVPNLLYTYNLRKADCPDGGTCSMVHHTDIKGWHFSAAKRLVSMVNLDPALEQQLLDAMAKDKNKFPADGAKAKTGTQGSRK
jgi:hypothetical protein